MRLQTRASAYNPHSLETTWITSNCTDVIVFDQEPKHGWLMYILGQRHNFGGSIRFLCCWSNSLRNRHRIEVTR
jgi:hypothetical protein